jgi:hypothetical protein
MRRATDAGLAHAGIQILLMSPAHGRVFGCLVMGLGGRSPLQGHHRHKIKSAGFNKPIHGAICWEERTPLPAGRACPLWRD